MVLRGGALLRHPPPGQRLWHPHGAGAPGAQEREDDDDLHAVLNRGGRGVKSPMRELSFAKREANSGNV